MDERSSAAKSWRSNQDIITKGETMTERWIYRLLLVAVLGVAVGIALATGFIVRSRNPDLTESSMTGDQLFMLGVIFTGAGVALMASIGPEMIGIMALGIIYMGMGARMKRSEEDDRSKGTT